MLVSAATDKKIIVWKMQTKDIFDATTKFETPKVEQVFRLSFAEE